MVSKNLLTSQVKRRLSSLERDENGQTHPFYAYRPNPRAKDQALFLTSETRTQAAIAPNRWGKSWMRRFKEICVAVGWDPMRPNYRFPFDAKVQPILIWTCCPPKNVRDELRDQISMIPPGIKYRAYWSRGEERIEFEPTPLRPRGAIIKIKSYGMPRDEFQRDAVHVISYDEEPPEYIWTECRQRLLTTKGWILISMTPVNGSVWLYEKLNGLREEYRGAQKGDFSWFSGTQFECSWIDTEDIEKNRADMTEDEYMIRVMGQYRLMTGSEYFRSDALDFHWHNFTREPEFTVEFSARGNATYQPWNESRKLDGSWRIWELPMTGATYALGADVAEGVGGDYSVATILNSGTGELVATFSSNMIEPFDFGVELGWIGRCYNTAVIAPEINKDGSAVLVALRGYPRLYKRETFGGRIKNQSSSDYGWLTSSPSKRAALQELHAAVIRGTREEPGGIVIRDSLTINELRNFGYLKEHRRGSHGTGALTGNDDRVMSLAIAYQALSQAPVGMVYNQRIVHKNEARRLIEQDYELALAEQENRKRQEREELGF